jgi:hypothetical protein
VISKLLPLEAEITKIKNEDLELTKLYTSNKISIVDYRSRVDALGARLNQANKNYNDYVQNDFVRKLAYNLLNFPEESSAQVYRYKEIGLYYNVIERSIDTAEVWLGVAVARITDSLNNSKRNTSSSERQVVVPGGLRPDGNPKFWGDFLLKVDIKNSTVSLAMDVYTSIDAGNIEIIRGGMDDNAKAGTLDLVVSGSTFDMNIGTENAPCKVNFSFGRYITGEGTMYFQVNNRRSGGNVNASNFNLKFGVSGQVSAGASKGIGFGIEAYGSIFGGIAFSLNASRYDNFICSDNNQPGGLYGWYGEGKVKVYVGASYGIKVAGMKFDFFSARAEAKLRARGPVPLFVTGNVNFRYSVANYSGNFDLDFTYGTSCNIPGL